MTPNREDYIKAIYNYNIIDQKVTNKLLAESLEISAPSVSEMLNKLIDAKVLKKDKVLGYELSLAGQQEAQRLINKHRLWEVFLVEYLGYTWDQVHDDAEVLEHATSNLLLERLNAFLKYPSFCPHGSVIYGNEKREVIEVLLSSVTKGTRVIVHRVSESEGILSYLFNKKVSLGRTYEILNVDDFDASVDLLDDNGNTISLSKKASELMYVEVLV